MPSDRQALVAALGAAIQAYQRATDGFDDEVGRQLGLGPSDLRCLDWLTVGPMSAGELADATGLSTAATTSLLDRLEAKGYVRRERAPEDRRKVLVELTSDGSARLATFYGPVAAEGAGLVAGFSDDELGALQSFLVEATEAVDRQRRRVRQERRSSSPALNRQHRR